MLANWVRFRRLNDGRYIIRNLLTDDEFETDEFTVHFLRQLDGARDPDSVSEDLTKEEVDLCLEKLIDEGLVRDKRFLEKSLLKSYVTLWRPVITDKLRLISFCINGLLLISWLPLLIFSLHYFMNFSYDIYPKYIITGTVAGLVIGAVMHEFGHVFACLAYGGRVFEVGVMHQYFMPGAYVLINEDNIKHRMKRIQVSAAGTEMNLLLTAIFLLLSARFELFSGFFLGAAIQNVFLALLNLTFVNGFDGMTIMGELLGVNYLVDGAKVVVKNKLKKKNLRKCGMSGKVTVAMCHIIRFVQIAFVLVLALNIVEVISCFL